jgi:alpha-ketoglutarate-dependent taurine dioxygenase
MASALMDGNIPEKLTGDSTRGIVELDTEKWAIEGSSVETTLAEYYGAEVAGSQLSPPRDPAELRTRLRESAPRLAELTDHIRTQFDDGACGIFISKLGLAHLEVDQRRKAVFALAVMLGDVTETEPVDHRVVWDVRPQEAELRKFSMFSESDTEAAYHTDSTIVPIPERYFLLYAVQQAECGGGLSTLRDGRAVKEELEQTPDGRVALRVLTDTALPVRIPKAFRKKYGVTAKDGYSYVPVFAEKPMWRWRKDKIEQGLVAHPECATPDVRKALDTVADLLANRPGVRKPLPTDGIVIIDNHVAFHGRTAFTDLKRHLLRIRFQEPAA